MTSFYGFITQAITSSSLCTRGAVFVCYQLSFGKLKGPLIAVHDEIIIIFFLFSFFFLLMSDSQGSKTFFGRVQITCSYCMDSVDLQRSRQLVFKIPC